MTSLWTLWQSTQPQQTKRQTFEDFYATQVAVKPPTFVIFVNEEELMHFSYARFLENQIRKAFTFEGTPIRIIPRRRK